MSRISRFLSSLFRRRRASLTPVGSESVPATEVGNASSIRTILFLSANPASTELLDLGKEHFAISRCLERASKKHAFQVVAETAVTDDDLRRALLKFEPEIVHFSGHGSGRGGLVFEDAGEPLFVSGGALAGLLGLCSGHVKCVVLNACYSSVEARSIGSAVQYVIGMDRAIGDIAALKFSVGFYDALVSGRTYPDAFRFGSNAISLRGIPESLTPTLISREENETDKRINPRAILESRVASVQELISLLDFRADMILSGVEGDPSITPFERVRDMKPGNPIAGFGEVHGDFAGRFEELHERNKQALIDGHLVLSHELTARIRDLLSEQYKSAHSCCYTGLSREEVPLTHTISGQYAYDYSSQYPGPLPAHLKREPNEIILMWRREEEERRAREEEERVLWERRQAEEALRAAERRKRLETIHDLRRAAIKNGIVKEGERCPKCGFSYAWTGTECYICHHSREDVRRH
jgi:hypothetical protein